MLIRLFFELISNFFYALVRPFLSNVILIAILFSAFALIALSAFHHGSMDNGFKWGIESIVMGLSRSVFGIFLGLWLHRHETVIKRYAGKFMSPFVGALLIVLVLISPKVGQFDWLVDLVSVAIIFPFCVICGAQGSNSRLLRPILLVLGSASYPLYVLHKPFGEMMSILGGKIEVGYAPFSGLVLIAILVPLCVLIETYYDIPLRRWLTNSVFRKRDAV